MRLDSLALISSPATISATRDTDSKNDTKWEPSAKGNIRDELFLHCKRMHEEVQAERAPG
jgi:hypothetical protein